MIDVEMDYYARVKEAADTIAERVQEVPRVAVVLGSGLGDFANALTQSTALPYGDVPYWPPARVAGHEGRFVVGRLKGRKIAALAGRCHLYEGHDFATVTFGVRVLGLLGVTTLILTNAAGGVNTSLSQGAL